MTANYLEGDEFSFSSLFLRSTEYVVSSSIEWAVRSALIPRLQNETVPAGDDSLLGHSLYTPYLSMTESTEQTMAVHYARNSSLDRIREFLIRGEKLKAYHFAMDEKLWAHAMLIANSVDAQSFKEVAKEFIHSELGVKHMLHANSEHTPQPNGKESLRVVYSLLSGHGASSSRLKKYLSNFNKISKSF